MRCLYGYTVKDGTITPNPEELAIVRMVLALPERKAMDRVAPLLKRGSYDAAVQVISRIRRNRARYLAGQVRRGLVTRTHRVTRKSIEDAANGMVESAHG